MNVAAMLKQNNGYIERPLSWFRSILKPTELKLRGYVYTFSSNGNTCTIGYNALGVKLGMSKSSTWRAVKNEKEHNVVFVQRNGGKNSTYTYAGDVNREMRIRTELFFYTDLFTIDGETRTLTDAEVNVLSLIYTCTRYEKQRKFIGNYGDIANLLGLNYMTVRRAVAALFACELISRPKKGANRTDKSFYVANLKRLNKRRKLNDKATKRAESKQAKYIREVDARIDAQRSEDLLREKARRVYDNAIARIESDARGNVVHARLRRLEFEIPMAEIKEPSKLAELQREQRVLRIEYKQILQRLNIDEWKLDEKACLKRLQDERHRAKGGGDA